LKKLRSSKRLLDSEDEASFPEQEDNYDKQFTIDNVDPINNPINPINNFEYLLEFEKDPPMNKNASNRITRIKDCCQTANQIIHNVTRGEEEWERRNSFG